MKTLFSILSMIGMIAACSPSNSDPDNKSEPADSTSQEVTKEEESDSFQEIDSDEALIATALMAAPQESRADCKVIGYNMAGEFVTLKEGSNEFICLADDPKKEGFQAACYHQSLDAFMARGRELKSEGKTGKEIFDIREEEVKAGTLTMGKAGATLHIYYGPKPLYDPESAEVAEAKYRYVVYMPWATSASTGLPEAPVAPNHPWIMDAGTHRAHIMISPIHEAKKN